MTREELEGMKYSLSEIAGHIGQAQELVGKLGCLQSIEFARAKMAFNQLVNEELERGRFMTLEQKNEWVPLEITE